MPSHHPINGAKVEKELKARSQKNHRLASSGLPTDSWLTGLHTRDISSQTPERSNQQDQSSEEMVF